MRPPARKRVDIDSQDRELFLLLMVILLSGRDPPIAAFITSAADIVGVAASSAS